MMRSPSMCGPLLVAPQILSRGGSVVGPADPPALTSATYCAWNPWATATRFTTSAGGTTAGAGDPVGRVSRVAGGTGGDLIQATDARRPTVAAGGASLEFGGTHGLYTEAAVNLGSNIATVGFLFRTYTSFGTFLELGDDASTGVFQPAFEAATRSTPDMRGILGSGGDNFRRIEFTGGMPSAGQVVWYEYNNSTTPKDVAIFFDATAQATSIGDNDAAGTGNYRSDTVHIGLKQADGASPSGGYTGAFEPFLVASRVLTAGEKADWRTWALDQAGLA